MMNGNDKENSMRDKFPNVVGEKAEIFYNGEWVKGKIVEGYRFKDGIVTIETKTVDSCGAGRREPIYIDQVRIRQ